MLSVASLNSGSNGNCYYIANENEAVLIDAGISCRETERRMIRMGLSIKKVKAIFISHEHIDHVRGMAVLSAKHNIPVYITPQTQQHSRLDLSRTTIYGLQHGDSIAIGELQVNTFFKYHDAIDPCSFTVEGNGITIGVFTDLGVPCDGLQHHFSMCHAAFLESNYDWDMLDKGRYPIYLKNRIRGGKGHLSNDQALAVFNGSRSEKLSHLFLSHLSKENNCPELVANLFKEHAKGVEIVVASRYQETGVYYIDGNTSHMANAKVSAQVLQPTLF